MWNLYYFAFTLFIKTILKRLGVIYCRCDLHSQTFSLGLMLVLDRRNFPVNACTVSNVHTSVIGCPASALRKFL